MIKVTVDSRSELVSIMNIIETGVLNCGPVFKQLRKEFGEDKFDTKININYSNSPDYVDDLQEIIDKREILKNK